MEHFVGPVTYTVTNMLLKNKDPVSEDFMTLLQHSKAPFIKGLFATSGETKAVTAKRKDTKFQGVASKFQKQLEQLLTLVGYSELHFVRCIKPNLRKVPGEFDEALVRLQLNCSGIFEAVRVIGMGFPDRLPHFHIIRGYLPLTKLEKEEEEAAEAEGEGEDEVKEEASRDSSANSDDEVDTEAKPLPF